MTTTEQAARALNDFNATMLSGMGKRAQEAACVFLNTHQGFLLDILTRAAQPQAQAVDVESLKLPKQDVKGGYTDGYNDAINDLAAKGLLYAASPAPVVPDGWIDVKDKPLYKIEGNLLEIIVEDSFLCAVPVRDTWDIAYVEIDHDCDLVYCGSGDTMGWTMQAVAFYRFINMPDAPPAQQQADARTDSFILRNDPPMSSEDILAIARKHQGYGDSAEDLVTFGCELLAEYRRRAWASKTEGVVE